MQIRILERGTFVDIRDLLVKEDEPTVILDLEDGRELECAVLTIFEVEEKEYMALFPLDGEDDSDILLYGYKEVGEDDLELIYIADDEEYEKVSDAFDMLLDEAEYEEAFSQMD